jgi:hypothetical protein
MSGWRIFWLLVLALTIFFIITQPEEAADLVAHIASLLVDVADSIITFFTELV